MNVSLSLKLKRWLFASFDEGIFLRLVRILFYLVRTSAESPI